MDKASEAILSLQPVTFRYKHELDPDGIPQFGLVAEQVEKVNPDLVVRDADGKVNTVRYEAVNAMLLNEFLKEHRKVEEQDRKVQEQQATIAQVNATIAKQDATITQLTSMVTQQQKDFQAAAAHQQEQIEALTAGLQKVSARLELNKPAPQLWLTISKAATHQPQLPHNPMKTQKKNSQGLYLQTRNNRWKWMAGATAATAAGVTASQASTITINLVNNYISATWRESSECGPHGRWTPGPDDSKCLYTTYVAIGPNYARVSLNGVRASCSYYNDHG